ncbi:TPA_asm: P4 [Chrysanthemum trirhavirus 1]|nr:TPA_asm: P4 [Chrysanthemum trirhavirus 1]
MGILLQLLLILLEKFGEHTVMVVDIFVILMIIHYFLNIQKIAKLMRYISALNAPLIPSSVNTTAGLYRMSLD